MYGIHGLQWNSRDANSGDSNGCVFLMVPPLQCCFSFFVCCLLSGSPKETNLFLWVPHLKATLCAEGYWRLIPPLWPSSIGGQLELAGDNDLAEDAEHPNSGQGLAVQSSQGESIWGPLARV